LQETVNLQSSGFGSSSLPLATIFKEYMGVNIDVIRTLDNNLKLAEIKIISDCNDIGNCSLEEFINIIYSASKNNIPCNVYTKKA
jgi:hypothetical protein